MHRGKFADCNFLGRRAYFPRHWTPRVPHPVSTFRDPSVRQKRTKRERFGTPRLFGGKRQKGEKKKKNSGEPRRISVKRKKKKKFECPCRKWMTPFQSCPVSRCRFKDSCNCSSSVKINYSSPVEIRRFSWESENFLQRPPEKWDLWNTQCSSPWLRESDGGNARDTGGVEIDLEWYTREGKLWKTEARINSAKIGALFEKEWRLRLDNGEPWEWFSVTLAAVVYLIWRVK